MMGAAESKSRSNGFRALDVDLRTTAMQHYFRGRWTTGIKPVGRQN